jgi:hypothetical protein
MGGDQSPKLLDEPYPGQVVAIANRAGLQFHREAFIRCIALPEAPPLVLTSCHQRRKR